MIKYCKILDENTGLVEIGAGCDDEYYIEIGMKKRDVEQSEKDFKWYLKDKCPHYTEEELIEQREIEFKGRFFKINYQNTELYYRKQPKGYSSAVESLNTAFNAVNIMQKLPANMLIFYQEPDFTKPEECTEEWLIAHQIFNEEMTVQEFGTFYVSFMTAWNTQEHN